MNRKTYTPSPPGVIIPPTTCIKYAGFYLTQSISLSPILKNVNNFVLLQVSLLFTDNFPLRAIAARREKYVVRCLLSQSPDEHNFLPSAARTEFTFADTSAGSYLFPV